MLKPIIVVMSLLLITLCNTSCAKTATNAKKPPIPRAALFCADASQDVELIKTLQETQTASSPSLYDRYMSVKSQQHDEKFKDQERRLFNQKYHSMKATLLMNYAERQDAQLNQADFTKFCLSKVSSVK